jgi:hypothetical protein
MAPVHISLDLHCNIGLGGKTDTKKFEMYSETPSAVNITSSLCHQNSLMNLLISVPPNGLVIYCGTIVTDEGKEKKVNIDFEPFRPINTSLYLCDNKFHTEVRMQAFRLLHSLAVVSRACRTLRVSTTATDSVNLDVSSKEGAVCDRRCTQHAKIPSEASLTSDTWIIAE